MHIKSTKIRYEELVISRLETVYESDKYNTYRDSWDAERATWRDEEYHKYVAKKDLLHQKYARRTTKATKEQKGQKNLRERKKKYR